MRRACSCLGKWKKLLRFSVVTVLVLALLSCQAEEVVSPSAPTPSPTPTAEDYTIYLPNISQGEDPTSTPSPVPSPRPSPSGPSTPTPLPPPVFKPGAGIQVHLFAGEGTETLRWAEGLGVEWVKQQVDWNVIEHGPEDLDWVLLDRVVDMCEGFEFKLLLSVINAPGYLRSDPTWFGPPEDYGEYRRFMQQMSERYQGRVEAYELWNEPNLAREWTGDTLSAERFVALVAEGAQGVRAGDPDALIISGAPAVTGINDGEGAIDDRVFLQGMLEAGVTDWVDGIGAHPYGFANPPEASVEDEEHTSSSHNNHPSFFFRDTLYDYRALLVDHGAEDVPIWITEFGWPSVDGMGPMDTTGWEYAREVSEEEQAQYIVRAFDIALELPWVGPVILWNLNISTIWGNERAQSAYSLLRPDGSYRPAYIAVRLASLP